MDEYVIPNDCRFIARYGDDYLFEIDFEVVSKLTNQLLVNIFILTNKYYPSFTYYEGSIGAPTGIKWEDLILTDYDLLRDTSTYFDIYLNIPVFVDLDTEEKIVYTEHGGLKITHEYDKNDIKRLFIGVYANVYTDANYKSSFDEEQHKWIHDSIDQKRSAAKNRSILSSFLQELEVVVNSKIKGFESSKIDTEYLQKYGFNENVALRHI